MVGLGIGIFFAGYTLLAYGWSQIHGSNASIVELAWPGSYQGPNLDSGTAPAAAPPATTKSTTASVGTPSTSTAAQRRNTNQNHVAK